MIPVSAAPCVSAASKPSARMGNQLGGHAVEIEGKRKVERGLGAGQQHHHKTGQPGGVAIDVLGFPFGYRKHPVPETKRDGQRQNARHDPGDEVIPCYPSQPGVRSKYGKVVIVNCFADRLDAFAAEPVSNLVVGFESDQPVDVLQQFHPILDHSVAVPCTAQMMVK